MYHCVTTTTRYDICQLCDHPTPPLLSRPDPTSLPSLPILDQYINICYKKHLQTWEEGGAGGGGHGRGGAGIN